VRLNSLTGGDNTLSGRKSLRTLAYTFMYSCSTEYSKERPFTSLVSVRIHCDICSEQIFLQSGVGRRGVGGLRKVVRGEASREGKGKVENME
jgi:hypothetical protein